VANATPALSDNRSEHKIVTGEDELHKFFEVEAVVVVLVKVSDNVLAVPFSVVDYVVFSQEGVDLLGRDSLVLVSVHSAKEGVWFEGLKCS